jgi:phosphatidylethanolamine-binding protein (PEBP) family uncharacterized protein
MRASRIASVLAATALLALLAGCGGGSTATQSAGVTTTTTVSSAPSSSTSGTSSDGSSSTSSTAASTSAGSTTAASTSSNASTTAASSSHTSTSTSRTPAAKPAKKIVSAHLALASAAFPRGGRIPVRYTCEGGNVSPPLQWGKLPAGTAQLFLIALSLNAGAGGAVRWAVGGIDPADGGFGAGQLPAGAVVGRNSQGQAAWAGACPAKGAAQSIVVLVYALRHPLNLPAGFEASAAQRQLAGDSLGTGIVYSSYQRP